MANPYEFKTDLGDVYIPIADAEYEISDMSASYSTGQCYVQFYDAQKSPVTPSGGTVTLKAGAFDGQKLEPSNGNGIINAADVVFGNAIYMPPQFEGCVVFSSMTLSGITGATYVKAYHWRDE